MTTPDELFTDPHAIRSRLQHFTNQFTPMRRAVENEAQTPDHLAMGNEDAKSAAALSEAKIAATLEIMRRENSEARAEMRTAMANFQTENALFRETIRGFISGSQTENALFREQIKDGISAVRVDMSNQAKDVEGKISGLKVWVLAGTISGLLAVLLMVGGALVRNYVSSTSLVSAADTPNSRAPLSAPESRQPPSQDEVSREAPAKVSVTPRLPSKASEPVAAPPRGP